MKIVNENKSTGATVGEALASGNQYSITGLTQGKLFAIISSMSTDPLKSTLEREVLVSLKREYLSVFPEDKDLIAHMSEL